MTHILWCFDNNETVNKHTVEEFSSLTLDFIDQWAIEQWNQGKGLNYSEKYLNFNKIINKMMRAENKIKTLQNFTIDKFILI